MSPLVEFDPSGQVLACVFDESSERVINLHNALEMDTVIGEGITVIHSPLQSRYHSSHHP